MTPFPTSSKSARRAKRRRVRFLSLWQSSPFLFCRALELKHHRILWLRHWPEPLLQGEEVAQKEEHLQEEHHGDHPQQARLLAAHAGLLIVHHHGWRNRLNNWKDLKQNSQQRGAEEQCGWLFQPEQQQHPRRANSEKGHKVSYWQL